MKIGNVVIKNQVILNLIQDFQRLLLSFINDVRGRFQIKFGMTSLFNNNGFTLIELLVVVLIIGILAAVAVPQYQKAVTKSRLANIQAMLASIKNAEEVYYLANGQYTNNIEDLDLQVSCKTVCGDTFKCDEFFIIDPLVVANNNLAASYCPSQASVGNCQAQNVESCWIFRDFTYTLWFNHSDKPNKIECTGYTDFGDKICNNVK